MKAIVLCLFALTSFVANSAPAAQATGPVSNQAQAPATGTAISQDNAAPTQYRPGEGTILVAELTNAISSKRAKVGDRVACIVSQDLVYHGKIVIPRNAKVLGRVTEVQASTKEHRESRLGLSFDRVLLKDKQELFFQNPAIVIALAPPIKRIFETNTKVDDLPVAMQKGAGAGAGSSSGPANTSSSAVTGLSGNVLGADVPSRRGAIDATYRGVIGRPGLLLVNGTPGTPVIASAKNNIELSFDTQLVLRVTETAGSH
jgi:hypothetical protein